MATIDIYWEDLPVGHQMALGEICPTRAQIVAFAQQFDPQPFHLDEAAARDSMFGALCASGWHTCALVMRQMVDHFLSRAASLGSPGVDEIRWLKPVWPDERLQLSYIITESRPLNSRPDVGLIRSLTELRNPQGELVMHMQAMGLFRRRHAAQAVQAD